VPLHDSATSQEPAAARQVFDAGSKRQNEEQQEPGAPFAAPTSQFSSMSTTLSPHRARAWVAEVARNTGRASTAKVLRPGKRFRIRLSLGIDILEGLPG